MATCLVIGDPHFKVDNVRETTLLAEKTMALLEKRRPDFIVCLGDILDTHEKIHVGPLRRAVDWLHEMSKYAPVYLIIGNHDRPHNSCFLTHEHAFTAVHLWPTVTVVDVVKTAVVKGQEFVFVPYVPPGRFIEALNTVRWKDARCIFAHQEFHGCALGQATSTEGDKWQLDYPLVISGHIHGYDRPQANIIYTGMPYCLKRNDYPPKTVSWFDLGKDVDNAQITTLGGFRLGEPKFETRIDLEIPKMEIFTMTCTAYRKDPPVLYAGSRLILTGTQEEIKTAKRLISIKRLTEQGVRVQYLPLVAKALPQTKVTIGFAARLNQLVQGDAVLESWVARLNRL